MSRASGIWKRTCGSTTTIWMRCPTSFSTTSAISPTSRPSSTWSSCSTDGPGRSRTSKPWPSTAMGSSTPSTPSLAWFSSANSVKKRGSTVKLHDMVIHESDAEQINAVLTTFLGESGATEALLIDRSGQLLAETELTVLFHQGNKESMHVSTVDDQAILVAIFGERTTVGMVRLFAKEAATAIGQILAAARAKPNNRGALSKPLTADESRTSFGEPKKP